MSAVERDLYTHAGRVIGRLENGHNTPSVRREAIHIIQSGAFEQDSQIFNTLHKDVVSAWRHLGPVYDNELDTVVPKELVTPKSR